MCNVDTFGRTEATKITVRDQILSPDHWWMMKLTPPTHVAVISSISFILYFVLSFGRSISSWVALLCSGAFAIFNNAKKRNKLNKHVNHVTSGYQQHKTTGGLYETRFELWAIGAMRSRSVTSMATSGRVLAKPWCGGPDAGGAMRCGMGYTVYTGIPCGWDKGDHDVTSDIDIEWYWVEAAPKVFTSVNLPESCSEEQHRSLISQAATRDDDNPWEMRAE